METNGKIYNVEWFSIASCEALLSQGTLKS